MTKINKEADKFFIRRDFSWIDSGLYAVLGAQAVVVWDVIYRYTWRGKNRKYGSDCRTKVSQTKVAKLTGLSKITVNREIRRLKKFGIIETVGIKNLTTYKTGTWHTNDKGKRVEELFADAVAQKGIAKLRVWAIDNGYESVSKIEEETRAEVMLGILEDGLVDQDTSQRRIVSISETYDKHLSDVCNTSQRRQPYISKTLQEVDKGKLDNYEEKNSTTEDNLRVSRPESLPPERSGGGQEVGVAVDSEGLKKSVKHNSAPVTRRVEPSKVVMDRARAIACETSDASLRKTQAREAKILGLAGSSSIEGVDPAINLLANFWEKHYKINFPDFPHAKWEGKERGIVSRLIKKYDGPTVRNLFDFVLNEWELATASFKQSPTAPNIGWVSSLHSSFIPTALQYSRVAEVWREWQEWWDANPNESDAPPELEAKFEKHQKAMNKLGLLRQA
jgi:hypothetical protein